jgi:hypothetical protein
MGNSVPVERDLPETFPDILAAIALLKEYGAVFTYDSRKEGRQQGDHPVRVFTLPKYGNAQIALRLNKSKTTIYLPSRSVSGRDIESDLRSIGKVDRRYTGAEKPEAPSVLRGPHARYLHPSSGSPLLKIDPTPGDFRKVIALYLGPPPAGATDLAKAKDLPIRTGAASTASRMDLQAFLEQLDRNAETGKRGELAALQHEYERLQKLTPPCPNPEQYVMHVAPADVTAGFDIRTTWPGQERFIEVKSTTLEGGSFFLTRNELEVLERLADSAWLYRVTFLPDGTSRVLEIQNPIPRLRGRMSPTVWKVTP